jgi:hypothetical protein
MRTRHGLSAVFLVDRVTLPTGRRPSEPGSGARRNVA